MQNINKNSISQHLTDRLGISKKFFDDVVDTLFEEIINLAKTDSTVKIKNFGSFNVSKKSARPGNIINQNQMIMIEERLVLNFSPSRSLKERINKIS